MKRIYVTVLLTFLAVLHTAAARASHPMQAKGTEVLKKYCTECHTGQLKFDANSIENMKSTGVLVAGTAAKSPIWMRLVSTTKPMPPKGSPQPTASEKQAVKDWIESNGSVVGNTDVSVSAEQAPRKWIRDSELLSVVVADLQATNERELPFIRYFSLANLYRNPQVKDAEIARYRVALDKLLNSLSWSPTIIKTKPLGPNGVLLRLDVRSLRWERDAWEKVIRSYPYAYRPKDGGKNAELIRTLSGAAIPFIRVDWFVANASRPPLYNDLLKLPSTALGLEQKLGVDVARDMEQENDVHRGGMTNSNVSNNNRVVQRHTSNYGAYWKSFDFKDNEGHHDIFEYPMDFKEDGGEYIFHLPNKMLAYMITDASGRRLDSAPVEVVFDKATPNSTGIITNGLSCIGCHAAGLKPVDDKVRKSLLKLNKSTSFDLEKARAIYTGSEAINAKVEEDNIAFKDALSKIGTEATNPTVEPIVTIARYYLSNSAAVTTTQAAADLGISVVDFQKGIARSTELQQMGLTRLEDEDGAIKRDTWEKAFPAVVRELGLGNPGVMHEQVDRSDSVSKSRASSPASETLRLSLDRGTGATYKVGENVGVDIVPGFSGHMYVYSIDAKGSGALLFPYGKSAAFADGKVDAGDSINFGRATSFLPVEVNEATGDELVIAVLLERAQSGLPGVSSVSGSKGIIPVELSQSSMRASLTALVKKEKAAGRMAVISEVRLRTTK